MYSMKLLLATRNRGKAKDLQSLLAGTDIEVIGLDAFPHIPEVEEDGDTFAANARKKAIEYQLAAGLPTLADDSGLVVDALDGAPGVYSARYAGEPSNDEANNCKLLHDLAHLVNPAERTARFVSHVVFVPEPGTVFETHGKCEGHIDFSPHGSNGFGYDPLFIHEKYAPRSLGEVSQAEKNAVSHRGQAMRAMLEILLNWRKNLD